MKLEIPWAIALLLASAAAYAENAPIPKYVERARELVATVKPENNHYEYHANNRFEVHWKDDGYKENAVDTA